MDTATVYVDGFNLYFRCLQHTPYKWLDVAKLAALILPKTEIVRIRYFTARIHARAYDPDAPTRQQVYLRALETIPNLTIHFGHFQSNIVKMPLAEPGPNGEKFSRVIRTDEKGSDVNIATYLLLDAFRNESTSAFVLSNDSDLAEPIRIAKADLGMRIGVCLPCRGRPSVVLGQLADFLRPIRKGMLVASQFPATMEDAQGAFSKPASW